MLKDLKQRLVDLTRNEMHAVDRVSTAMRKAMADLGVRASLQYGFTVAPLASLNTSAVALIEDAISQLGGQGFQITGPESEERFVELCRELWRMYAQSPAAKALQQICDDVDRRDAKENAQEVRTALQQHLAPDPHHRTTAPCICQKCRAKRAGVN